MRRLALITALLALVLAAAGATLAAAKGPAKHHTQRQLTIYTVTPKDGLAVLPGQAGTFSLGDRVAFSDDLFTSKGGGHWAPMAVPAQSRASPTPRPVPASSSVRSPSRYPEATSRPRR